MEQLLSCQDVDSWGSVSAADGSIESNGSADHDWEISMGDPPRAGWFLLGKIPSRNGFGGSPIFRKPPLELLSHMFKLTFRRVSTKWEEPLCHYSNSKQIWRNTMFCQAFTVPFFWFLWGIHITKPQLVPQWVQRPFGVPDRRRQALGVSLFVVLGATGGERMAMVLRCHKGWWGYMTYPVVRRELRS